MPSPARSMVTGRRALVALGLAAVAALAWGYHYVTTGGMSARQSPPQLERALASKLVQLGIPRAARDRRSPLDGAVDGADVAAGRALYEQDCAGCHGTDGRGTTMAGGGLYPPPMSLDADSLQQRQRTDGELFYLIENGIRNTGMPGWQFLERQLWQLVAHVRHLPPTASPAQSEATSEHRDAPAQYVGSVACRSCHADVYDRWKKTPMANVVRDPREHPDAVVPDFGVPDPLLTFTRDDVALVYGSRWKQRYFKKVGDDYFVLPAQWDITHKKWRPYFVKDDWWAPLYPPDNMQRPTSALCDGCHSVNFDVKTRQVTEWNVGCERCHGPGSEHVESGGHSRLPNGGRETSPTASDVCLSCHSQGRPRVNPIDGKSYDWPVGYDPTRNLRDFWKLEEHTLGQTTFTHFADGTAHKNRMQGNDFVQSEMYTHGVTCSTCHDAHGTSYPASLRKPAQAACLDCHGPRSPNGPHAATLEAHTHHAAGSVGSECIGCHMPRIEQTIGDVNVRSHTFRFVTPTDTETAKVPNACNACHADKTTAWATAALATWSETSTWRVAP